MQKYGDFSNKHTKSTGWFGLELEVEATAVLPIVENGGWTTKADDSLRFVGREYVTTRPMSDKLAKLEMIIGGLVNKINNESMGLIKDSPRTSFHVHMNTYHLTPIQVLNVATLYWLLEPCLVSYCGKPREGNLFCLRLQDAEDILHNIVREIKANNVMLSRGDNETKYAGLNILPVNRLGTIEFRCMRASYEAQDLVDWVATIAMIRDVALEYNSPRDICDMFYKSNKAALIERTCRPRVAAHIFSLPDWQKRILTNEALLNSFAYANNWKSVEQSFNKAIETLYMPTFRRVRAADVRPGDALDEPPVVADDPNGVIRARAPIPANLRWR